MHAVAAPGLGFCCILLSSPHLTFPFKCPSLTSKTKVHRPQVRVFQLLSFRVVCLFTWNCLSYSLLLLFWIRGPLFVVWHHIPILSLALSLSRSLNSGLLMLSFWEFERLLFLDRQQHFCMCIPFFCLLILKWGLLLCNFRCLDECCLLFKAPLFSPPLLFVIHWLKMFAFLLLNAKSKSNGKNGFYLFRMLDCSCYFLGYFDDFDGNCLFPSISGGTARLLSGSFYCLNPLHYKGIVL